MEMSRLTRDGTAEPVLGNRILRHEREQRNIHFLCSADHEQDRQPYPVDPYYCYMCDHTYIHGHAYSKSMDQTGKVTNPALGQLNRENEYFSVRVRA